MMAILTDPGSISVSSVVFVTTYLLLKQAATKRGLSSTAGRLMAAHNYLQVLLSLTILLLTLASLFPPYSSFLARIQADDAYIPRLVYHYSKIYEYCDIFLVAAIGRPVGLHFFFHHLTTPWFTLARVVNSGQGWQLFAALNAFHHALSKRLQALTCLTG
jgi:hypothetical protein